jgi:hypothetical protein
MLFVILGSVVGVLIPLFSGNARTRRVLRKGLTNVLGRYVGLRPKPTDPSLAWDLEPYLGPPREDWFSHKYPGLLTDPGVSPVWTSIRSARSGEDLGSDAAPGTGPHRTDQGMAQNRAARGRTCRVGTEPPRPIETTSPGTRQP